MTIFLIIDGNSLGMRAALSIPKNKPDLVTREGIPTGTIVRFFNMLNKILMQIKPTHVAFAWDTGTETFRKKLYPLYKANRHKNLNSDVDLKIVYKQFKFIRFLLNELGILSINVEGFEGDDVCGSLLTISQADVNYIISGDKDVWSLINSNTQIIFPKMGFTDFDFVNAKHVEKKYDITIDQYLDLKSLCGDKSDNILGYKGCGMRTAAKMLNEFGSTDVISSLSEEDLAHYNKTIRTNLKDWQSRYKLIKQLVTIRTDISIEHQFNDFQISLLNWNKIKPFLQDLEMYDFINRIAYGAVYRLKW